MRCWREREKKKGFRAKKGEGNTYMRHRENRLKKAKAPAARKSLKRAIRENRGGVAKKKAGQRAPWEGRENPNILHKPRRR